MFRQNDIDGICLRIYMYEIASGYQHMELILKT